MNPQSDLEMPTILIIDDDKISIDLIQVLFEDEYQIIGANSAADGMKTALSMKPDLILLDIRMPGMDGYEVCKILRDNPVTTSIPIIFLTAKQEIDDEKQGLELGAIDYITKPIVHDIVKARVRNHLRQKHQHDLLTIQSTTDSLTGIANRRRLDEFLEVEWRRATRSKMIMSLMMIDIDYFKNFNDTYGHAEGDNCLKSVSAEILRNIRRPSDLVARYGGEEFCVVLPETFAGPAAEIAEHIRTNIEGLKIPHSASASSDFVTVSIGVATALPNTDEDAHTLLEAADKQLYRAKETGRNKLFSIEI